MERSTINALNCCHVYSYLLEFEFLWRLKLLAIFVNFRFDIVFFKYWIATGLIEAT